MSESKAKSQGAVQTTGHAWDGDLQEFNNPLPNWQQANVKSNAA